MNRQRVVILFSLMLIAVSCSSSKKDIQFSLFHEKVVGKAADLTRTAKIYRDLDTIIIADVFWYSTQIKKDFIEEIRADGRIGADRAMKMLSEIEETEGEEIEFLAGIYTGDKKWNDFSSDSSMWSVWLQTSSGSRVEPAEISKVNLNKMKDSHLYPFISHWKTTYRITFPRKWQQENINSYTLRFSSILGEAKFRWEF